jgi:endonuclease YncB( thermonuclease family)
MIFNRILRLTVLLVVLTAANVGAGEFKIVRVYDGDTVLAKGHDIEIKVRLAGIDAPETGKKKRDPGQPFSQQAKQYLAQLVLNKTVDIKGYGLGPYNRVIGELYLHGQNVNRAMVYYGMAEVYRGDMPRGFNAKPYWEAESKSWTAKAGIWSLGADYVSPRDYRKQKKG